MRWSLSWLLLITLAHFAEAGEKSGWGMASPLVFADEQARIQSGDPRTEKIEAVVDVLGPVGWGKPSVVNLDFQGDSALLKPSGVGIHRVKLPGGEVRFVAVAPPEPAVGPKAFPRLWEKLSRGEPVTILVMGDSVTATGSYPEMLAMMLRRATGGEVRIERRAYSGRSVDASVRRFEADVKGLKPDLALIMYGLNDQGANVPLIAYLEQYAWLAERLRKEYGAEVAFLEPTPHINILTPGKDGQLPAEAAMFRTIVYAAALRDLGAKLNIPVAETFSAIWGSGAADLKREAKALWPLYPTHYSKPFESLVEISGKGDTIHPNALGHSLLARAVFECLLGKKSAEHLKTTAWTQWGKAGLETVITAENISRDQQHGQVCIYPLPENDLRHAFEYDLAPGERAEWSFLWPDVRKPADLLREPLRRIFRPPGSFVQVLYRENGRSCVTAISAPLRSSGSFPPQRLIVQMPEAEVEFLSDGAPGKIRVSFPPDQDVGRLVVQEGEAIAELSFVRFGAALSGEAVIDGTLDEWTPGAWLPVGEVAQARWTNGPQDNRKTVEECYTRWSFAAGKEGIFIAFRGTANPAKDTVTVYFDTREPDLLGSAGPYFWADIKFAAEGRLSVKMGDSSPVSEGPRGAWKEKDGELSGEVFVPYAALGLEAWPLSGDLGLSIAWRHSGPDGKTTTLQWAEDGHPWNTRWFGVVRLNPVAPLPFRVRVE
jgi:lysophospholipase L1-like esterase